jgi:cell division protein FtsN
MASQQPGGFVMGLIVGLLLGLALALGVALYVNKVPAPFVNKVPHRTAEQDAAEAEKNKNWDPNAPLAGKTPMRPASAPVTPLPPPAVAAPAPGATKGTAPREPATGVVAAPTASAPQVASTKVGPDPFTYFVQAGAFGRAEDAEQQRARLALLGVSAKVTEREQAGRTVYRVRLGPYEKKDEADAARARLESGGVEAALVRVQR